MPEAQNQTLRFMTRNLARHSVQDSSDGQARTIQKLVDENPAYMANITFVDVDYDRYGNSSLANRLAIPRRSTLVVLKGAQELGRIVAGTRRDDIKELLDIALAAATTS